MNYYVSLMVFLGLVISGSTLIYYVDIQANALESYRGHDYTIEQLDNDTYRKTIGLEPFVYDNETKQFVPYIHRDGTTFTEHGTVTLDSDCTFNFYQSSVIDENSTALFQDKILVKAADTSSPKTWERLDLVNNASCNKSWGAAFEQFSTGKLRTDIGMLEYKYIINDGTWKTQLEATNLSNEDTKMFGFDQIIDLNTDMIQFGNNEINIDEFDGTVFDRTWLEQNDARVMMFEGFYFDVDLAWDYLNSVQVIDTGIDSSRIIFDYRTDSVLLPHETLIIDPTFHTRAQNYRVGTDAVTGTSCGTPSSITEGYVGDFDMYRPDTTTSSLCSKMAYEHSVEDIPDTADVTDVSLEISVSDDAGTHTCSIGTLDDLPSNYDNANDYQGLWDAIDNGAKYVTNDNFCDSNGVKNIDLGTTADSDLETALTTTDVFVLGIELDDYTRDGNPQRADFNTQQQLTITYNMPPDPPKLLDAEISAPDITFEWLAGELNGDTHSSYDMEVYNGTDWNQVFTQSGTNKTFTPTTFFNDTSKYRMFDTGSLGRGCSQFVMNGTVTANLQSHFPLCYTTNDNGLLDNDGTVTGDEVYDNSTGIVSFDFDGSSYITLPNESDYDFEHTDPFSMSGWVNFDSTGNGEFILAKRSVNQGYFMTKTSTDVIRFAINDGTAFFIDSTTVLSQNTWYHFTATYDGSSNQDGMKLFINGQLETTGASSTISNTILNNLSVVIGSRSDITATMNGNLYDVMIFDKELDANEVEQIYLERIDTHNILAPPDAPTLAVTGLSDTSARFTMTNGTSSGDFPVKDFGIRCEENGAGGWQTIVTNNTVTLPRIYENSSFTTQATLVCQARDGSQAGWSDWSNNATETLVLEIISNQRTTSTNPNDKLLEFINFIAGQGGVYFGLGLIPFSIMLIGFMAGKKTVRIFTLATLSLMGIVHASGYFVYPEWYWTLALFFGVILVLGRQKSD